MPPLLLLWSCSRPPPAPPAAADPLGTASHAAAEARAQALIPDPDRGGPTPEATASPLPPFSGVDRGAARYAGDAACAACHQGELARLADGPHQRSTAPLRAAGRDFDPRCLRCHVTGMGHPGGFEDHSASAALAHVGCEACHGPGSAHIARPRPGYGRLPAEAAACVACHDHDSSPDFTWSGWWPRIAHGPRAPEPPARGRSGR